MLPPPIWYVGWRESLAKQVLSCNVKFWTLVNAAKQCVHACFFGLVWHLAWRSRCFSSMKGHWQVGHKKQDWLISREKLNGRGWLWYKRIWRSRVSRLWMFLWQCGHFSVDGWWMRMWRWRLHFCTKDLSQCGQRCGDAWIVDEWSIKRLSGRLVSSSSLCVKWWVFTEDKLQWKKK